LVAQFKESLAEQIKKDYCMNSIESVKKIVEKLFPNENFFAFKLFSKKSDDKKVEKEMQEI